MKPRVNSIKSILEFTAIIDDMVKAGHDYIDAVVTYCHDNNVEIETAATLIKNSPKLKSHIKELAERLNLMKVKKEKKIVKRRKSKKTR